MPVVSVTRKWSGRSSGYGANGEQISSSYEVLLDGTDDPDEASRIARQANGIPRYNSPAPFDPFLFASEIQAIARSPILYDVIVTWMSASMSPGGIQPGTNNPLDEPARIEWTTSKTVEQIDEDIYEQPIVNTAGQPLSGVTRKFSDRVLTITKNQSSFSDGAVLPYLDTVNLNPWWGYDADKCYMEGIDAKKREFNDLIYYQVTYTIVVRVHGLWVRRILNQGTCELIYGTGEPTVENIADKHGEPVGEPWPLDPFGRKLLPGWPTHWLGFDVYERVDWELLNIL